MMMKKLTMAGVCSLAILGVSASIAGGPMAKFAPDPSGFFAGIDLGGVYNTELNYPNSILANGGTPHAPWGWTWSGQIGYQFDSNWAIQFGYIDYQSQELKQTGDNKIKFFWYNMYVAARVTVPLANKFSAYMLVGPTYTKATNRADIAVGGLKRSSESIWTPMGAIGITYPIIQNLNVSLQYMFIMSNARSVQTTEVTLSKIRIDANTQRLTVGVSYLFEM